MLQLIAIGLLNGEHSFTHHYYLIGTSFTACLMIYYVIKNNPLKFFLYVFIAFLYIHNFETSYYRLKPLIKGNILQDCGVLLKSEPRLKNEFKIRTHYSDSAQLGLCMGKIQNSKTAKFGVYRYSDVFPEDCKVIQRTKRLSLCEFLNSSHHDSVH